MPNIFSVEENTIQTHHPMTVNKNRFHSLRIFVLKQYLNALHLTTCDELKLTCDQHQESIHTIYIQRKYAES